MQVQSINNHYNIIDYTKQHISTNMADKPLFSSNVKTNAFSDTGSLSGKAEKNT